MNYINRHWRGELPLWQSFWVNGVLVLSIPPIIAYALPQDLSGVPFGLVGAIGGVIALPLWTWQAVGILRSARRRRDGWALAAMIPVTAYWVMIVGISIVTVYGLFVTVPLFAGVMYLGYVRKLPVLAQTSG
jgi:hypothetical protein